MDLPEERNDTGINESISTTYNYRAYNKSFQTYNREISASDVSLNIVLFYKLFILVIGLIGNITTIFVLRRTKTPITTRIILILLAISDSSYLLLNSPVIIALTFFGKAFADLSVETCNLAIFSFFFFPSISAWLVAILTLERCFAVLLPLSVKRIVSKKRLIVFLSVFVGIYLGWDCFIAYHAKLEVMGNYGGVKVCTISESILMIISIVTSFSDLIIPLLIVLVGNIIISCLIVIRKRNQTASGRSNSRVELESRLIGTMLAVSITFVVFSSPITIYYTLGQHLLGDDIYQKAAHPYFLIADSLTYTNFGVNFYLYVCFTKSFREELVKVTNKMKCFKPSVASAYETSQMTSQSSMSQTVSVSQTDISPVSKDVIFQY